MLLPLAIAIFAICILIRRQQHPEIHRHGARLKRPSDTLPVFGNALRFLQPRHVLFDWFIKQQSQFGDDSYQISVPSLPQGVVITSPQNIEFVFKNETVITKGAFFKQRSWDLFGYGIINATGELWRAQRKAGLKFFAGNSLDALVEDVLPEAYEHAQDKLSKLAETGEQMDLQRFFLDLTTTVVGQMAYDMDIDASSPFSKAFDYASDHVARRFQNPLYWLTELFTGSKFRSSVNEVRKFGRKIVNNAKQRRAKVAFESIITNEDVVFGSLIDSLIEAFRNPAVVADAAMNFLSAGRDTTAQSLTWTFYALMRHPEVLEKLRKVIDNDNLADEQLDVAKLQPANIPSIMAVYYEALRLYPPVPVEIKQCEADITLPDGTFLPQDSIIVWCLWAINRSPNLYGEDAHEFRPERWLNPHGHFTSKSAFEFPVFNGGPRSCLGKKMAELMGAYLIIKMVKEFDFEELKDPQGPEVERASQSSLTLPMEAGLPCTVKRRLGMR